ncbi:MAG: hypothetical protein ACP5HJ_01690, partial [Candidatus Micrarchaeia archaeon]
MVIKDKKGNWEIKRAKPKKGERLIGTFSDKQEAQSFALFLVNYEYKPKEIKEAYKDFFEIRKAIA